MAKEVFVIFESPEDTNLPEPLCALLDLQKAEASISVLKMNNPGIRYWYERIPIIQ